MWKSNSKVKYISPSGRESIKTIFLTAEGFASINDNGTELLFDTQGRPINTMFNAETNGPSIHNISTPMLNNTNNIKKSDKKSKSRSNKTFLSRPIPNYLTASFEQPWDNTFALKNLTIYELQEVLTTLINIGYGNQKLHLKNFGEYATIENKNKIQQIFLNVQNNKKEPDQ